jgi:broad specificity phosphatase PhoE
MSSSLQENSQETQPQPQHHRRLPQRIILVRHGESQGNLDTAAYSTTPDQKIPLTPHGLQQARHAGRTIHRILSDHNSPTHFPWGVYFYVSPYERTRSTLRQIGSSFPRSRILGAREECRIREQDFGNFQIHERMLAVKEARERFGRFFFRFPEGESAADVFDRVASLSLSLSLASIHHVYPFNFFLT